MVSSPVLQGVLPASHLVSWSLQVTLLLLLLLFSQMVPMVCFWETNIVLCAHFVLTGEKQTLPLLLTLAKPS